MNHVLRITSEAQRDVARISFYLSDIDVNLGLGFLDAFQMSCKRLQRSPDLGEIWSTNLVQPFELRGWCVRDFGSYVIYYHVLLDTVEIVRVLHSAQDAEAEL